MSKKRDTEANAERFESEPKTVDSMDAEAAHAQNMAEAEKQAAKVIADAERAVVHAGGIPQAYAPPPAVDRITGEQFARRKGRSTVAVVFVAEDRRIHGDRKLTESEWASLFDSFQKKPR